METDSSTEYTEYSLDFNLNKDLGLEYHFWLRINREDYVIDYFEDRKGDAEKWLTDFCCWASQENVCDSLKLKCAIVAMNRTDVFWAKDRQVVGTWENFLHLFRENFTGDCNYWASIQ